MYSSLAGSIIETKFHCAEHKQKLLLDALLRYSSADLTHLAILLDVSDDTLRQVLSNGAFLTQDENKALAHLFLMLFSD